MKKILLMRHAKSDWDNPSLRDFDRPLNKRGERDAPKMGMYLKELGIYPDQIFSSPANRAKATTLHVAEQLDLRKKVISWDEELYFTGPLAYANAIRRASNESTIVMTVGHNPMTDEVLSLLATEPVRKHFATATIACLEADIENWSDLQYGTCIVKWMVSPKDISS